MPKFVKNLVILILWPDIVLQKRANFLNCFDESQIIIGEDSIILTIYILNKLLYDQFDALQIG